MWEAIFPTANENTSTTTHADLANAVKIHIGTYVTIDIGMYDVCDYWFIF